MYEQIYNIIVEYVFNNNTLNTLQELATTEIALLFSLVVLALPFLVVLYLIKWVLSMTRYM